MAFIPLAGTVLVSLIILTMRRSMTCQVRQVLAIIMVGVLISKLGYYMQFRGCLGYGWGLFTKLSLETGTAQWIVYQILFGVGSGCGFQLPQIAAQTVLSFKDIPTGIAITLFFQSLGSSTFVSARNNILNDRLTCYIASLELSGVNSDQIV